MEYFRERNRLFLKSKVFEFSLKSSRHLRNDKRRLFINNRRLKIGIPYSLRKQEPLLNCTLPVDEKIRIVSKHLEKPSLEIIKYFSNLVPHSSFSVLYNIDLVSVLLPLLNSQDLDLLRESLCILSFTIHIHPSGKLIDPLIQIYVKASDPCILEKAVLCLSILSYQKKAYSLKMLNSGVAELVIRRICLSDKLRLGYLCILVYFLGGLAIHNNRVCFKMELEQLAIRLIKTKSDSLQLEILHVFFILEKSGHRVDLSEVIKFLKHSNIKLRKKALQILLRSERSNSLIKLGVLDYLQKYIEIDSEKMIVLMIKLLRKLSFNCFDQIFSHTIIQSIINNLHHKSVAVNKQSLELLLVLKESVSTSILKFQSLQIRLKDLSTHADQEIRDLSTNLLQI